MELLLVLDQFELVYIEQVAFVTKDPSGQVVGQVKQDFRVRISRAPATDPYLYQLTQVID